MRKLFANTPWGERPNLEDVDRHNDSISDDDLETPFWNDFQLYFDPQHLNGWLMFWDEICIPDYADHPTKDSGALGDFLEQQGVLRREPMWMDQMHGKGPTESQAHFWSFYKLDEREPGTWSFALGEEYGGQIPEGYQIPNRGVYVRLVDALPVPATETPIHDILEYKAKHKSELLALRDSLDDLYQSILSAPDRDYAEKIKIERVMRTSRDHLRAAEGFGFSMVPMNVEARFNVAAAIWTAAFNVMAGASNLQVVGNSFLAAAKIEVGPTVGFKGGNNANTHPYAYLIGFYKHVFRPGTARDLLSAEDTNK